MKWKVVGCLTLVLIVGIGVRWYSDGAEIYTKTARQTLVKDEMFGTESVVWKKGFWLGLDLAGPGALALAAVGVYGFVKASRKRK